MERLTLPLRILVILFLSAVHGNANVSNWQGLKLNALETVMSGCVQGRAETDLAINNVRARIFTSGDMWWNLLNPGQLAEYEVPKGGGVSSLFAGSIWVGGISAGQLKVAAMTYRGTGVDFWPGPLGADASISASECAKYDKHFIISRREVEDFVNSGYNKFTPAITNWPGNGDVALGQENSLAPFYDADGDTKYNPGAGDYPAYSLSSKKLSCDARQLYGDKTIWWVFNDKGNMHGETNSGAIGLEIRAQAFAFSSTDEINNMTFYDYEVINRSTTTLTNTYFGQWVDADLGCSSDDYVGCDVGKGLGYCYNGDAFDEPCEGGLGYGFNPPAIGMDFFRGPKANYPSDGLDANGVSFVDPETGRIGMAKFVYYNRGGGVQGDPVTAQDHYGYLTGFWKDGTPITYGGNGKTGTVQCDFMFPGDSDPNGRGTNNSFQGNWSEASVNNAPSDRRFIQSAGPFTLEPGAVNNITVGAVWARAAQGGPQASVQAMKYADIKAQALFKNCFNILNGPDAPDLTIQELDNQLIVYLTNNSNSNNYKEAYVERDPYMGIPVAPALPEDVAYKFEGYQIYQIVDSSVSVTELSNPDRSRLIFQCDLKNGHGQIINHYLNQNLGGIWVPQEMVNGGDSGVSRSFVVKKDMFAKGDDKLINHKQYYFMAIAYGYNHGEYNVDPNVLVNGYNLPYISSRRNIKAYTGIPHIVTPEAYGTEQNANYGDGVKLTRIEGQGNGGRVLEFTTQTVDDILKSGVYSPTNPNGARAINVTYANGAGPIDIKVVDPLNVADGCYEITVSDSTKFARWTLRNTKTGVIVAKSDTSLQLGSEQIIPSLGLSVKASYVYDPNYLNAPGSGGFLTASMTFKDPTKRWLTGLPDGEGSTNQNWIRSGKYKDAANGIFDDFASTTFSSQDEGQNFEKILDGTWAPYPLCAYSEIKTDPNLLCVGGPGYSQRGNLEMRRTLASVDIVFTDDKNKWTRCPVLEMQEEKGFAEGQAGKCDLRESPSVDLNGKKLGEPGAAGSDPTNRNSPDYIAATGMGWFPGYAINLETGERLNMAFGEDSGMPLENGRDMIWNPTSTVYSTVGFNPVFGGKHYIYVFSHTSDQKFASTDNLLPGAPKSVPRYDGGFTVWQLLNTSKALGTGKNDNYKKLVFMDAMWVNIPLLVSGRKVLEDGNQATVKIRVARKFRLGLTGFYGAVVPPATNPDATFDLLNPAQNRNYPMYTFCTSDLVAKKGINSIAKNAMDLINVVPNPYYAYSGYENNQTDNRVKFTNLPEKCTIRIYTLNGTLIRTFHKSEVKTSLDWDLLNQARIPVSSGLYIIHIDAPGVGEKVLKWFGVMRPVDLDSY